MNQHFSTQGMAPQLPPVPLIAPSFLKFLNSMPTSFDLVEWITQFRDALRQFLGHVDRVSINVNSNYNALDPHEPPVNLRILQSYIGPNLQQRLYVSASPIPESIIEKLKRYGFPFNEYQNPYVFDYFNDQRYLGTIVLFRYRCASPLPGHILEIMESLRPYIFFALSGAVMRYNYVHPAPIAFNRLLAELVDDLDLIPLDKEILTLRLLGFQNIEIAKQLHLSHHTITKHIQKILRKGGARHPVELFTRRFMPDLEKIFFIGTTAEKRDKGGRRKKSMVLPQILDTEIYTSEKKPYFVW